MPVKQLSSGFLNKNVGTDEKEPKFIQGCIDAITIFDDNKREQTYYRQVIKESYSYVMAKHSKVS